jgi:hypothetical protein
LLTLQIGGIYEEIQDLHELEAPGWMFFAALVRRAEPANDDFREGRIPQAEGNPFRFRPALDCLLACKTALILCSFLHVMLLYFCIASFSCWLALS